MGREEPTVGAARDTPRQGRVALDLSDTEVALCEQTATGLWRRLGSVDVSSESFEREIGELRDSALGSDGKTEPVVLWLPPDQILVHRAHLSAETPEGRRAEAMALFDRESIYKAGSLSVAASEPNDAGESVLLAALTQSCEEAAAHAKRWGFVPGPVSTRFHAERFGADGPVFSDQRPPSAWPLATAAKIGASFVLSTAVALAGWWLYANVFARAPEPARHPEPVALVAPSVGEPAGIDALSPDRLTFAVPMSLASPADVPPLARAVARAEPPRMQAGRDAPARPTYRLGRDTVSIGRGLAGNVPVLAGGLGDRSPDAAGLDPAERPFIDLERTADPVIDDLTVEVASLSLDTTLLSASEPVHVSTVIEEVDDSRLRQMAKAPLVAPAPPENLARPVRRAVLAPGSRRAPLRGVPAPRARPVESERGHETAVEAGDVVPPPPEPDQLDVPAEPTPARTDSDDALLANAADRLPVTTPPVPAPRLQGGDAASFGAPVPALVTTPPVEKPEPPAQAGAPEGETAAEPAADQPEPAAPEPAPAPMKSETPNAPQKTIAAAPATVDVQPSRRGSVPSVRKLPNSNAGARRVAAPSSVETDPVLDGAPALIGVVQVQSERQAIIRLPGGRFKRVRRGDELDGWRVGEIGRDSLRLELDGDSIILPLMPRR